MKSRFAIAILCCALSVQGTLGSIAIQVVAWTSMVQESVEMGFTYEESIRKAVSGQEPCHLCRRAISVSIEDSLPIERHPLQKLAAEKQVLGIQPKASISSLVSRPFLQKLSHPGLPMEALIAISVPTPPPKLIA